MQFLPPNYCAVSLLVKSSKTKKRKMLWFHYLSAITLYSQDIFTRISQVQWRFSQYLHGYQISSSTSSETLLDNYYCLNELNILNCYDQETNKKLIGFDLVHETIHFYDEAPDYFLCLSDLQHGTFALTTFANSHPICEINVPLRKEMSIDAYLFIDWNKIIFFLFNEDGIQDEMICNGLDSFFHQNSENINFYPIAITEQYGNPSGFLYWLDKCGYSWRSSTLNLIIVQLWKIDQHILQRGSRSLDSPSSSSPSLTIQSCPCIVKNIYYLNKTMSINETKDPYHCLEEIFQLFHYSIHKKSNILSLVGFNHLLTFLRNNRITESQSSFLSQELMQMIFTLQAYQSSSSSSSTSNSFHVTSLVRIILQRSIDYTAASREYSLFKEHLTGLFSSQSDEIWTRNYLHFFPYVELFVTNYLTPDMNSQLRSRFLRWLAELIFPCCGSFHSPRLLPHLQSSFCPISLLSSSNLIMFVEIIQILLINLPSSHELNLLQTILHDFTNGSIPLPSTLLSTSPPSSPSPPHKQDSSKRLTYESLYNTMFLIFVNETDVKEAESFVTTWRYSTPTPKHSYSYHIIPIQNCHEGYRITAAEQEQEQEPRDGEREREEEDGIVYIPCLRSVFLNVEQWIDEFSVNDDRVVVLIGREALFSLLYSTNPSHWMTMKIFITESRHFAREKTLLDSLIFARSPLSTTSQDFPVDVRVFTGFARDIKRMIHLIRQSPLYTITNQGPLIALHLFLINSKYIQKNNLFAYIDMKREYFDTRKYQRGVSLDVLVPSTGNLNHSDAAQRVLTIGNEILQTTYASDDNILSTLTLLSKNNPLEFLHLYQSFFQDLPLKFDILFLPYLMSLSRRIDYLDHTMSHSEKIQSIELLKNHILPLYSPPSHDRPNLIGLDRYSIVNELLSSWAMNLGRSYESISYYQDSYLPPLYSTIKSHSDSWNIDRLFYRSRPSSSSSSLPYKTWYFTIATHRNEKLNNLLLSAEIAGIEIEVLGLGLSPTGLDKANLYWQALHQPRDEPMADHDVVVLLDGYDIILTPAVKYIGQRLAKSPTPMLYGAEVGLFPHVTASWLHSYHLHTFSPWTSLFYRKYVNSGTFLGRFKETKDFFFNLNSNEFLFWTISQLYGEEQHLITRMVLQHPELLSIDHSNEIFFSIYQLPYEAFQEGFNSNFVLQPTVTTVGEGGEEGEGEEEQFRYDCVSVIHGNGLQGKYLYQFFARKMREVYQKYSDDGNINQTLAQIREWWRNHVETC